MVEGQNQQSRNDKASEFQGGIVHLCSSENAIADEDTTIDSDAEASTSDSDWSISHDNANGTTTLQNTSDIDFGSPSGFTIDQIVIESTSTTGNFIIDNGPTGDTDLSGDGSTFIEVGDLSYTFGSE